MIRHLTAVRKFANRDIIRIHVYKILGRIKTCTFQNPSVEFHHCVTSRSQKYKSFEIPSYSNTPLIFTRKLSTMKLDTPEFHALFTPELKQLIAIFEKYHYELRIAGGAVRDLLLGKTSNDVDFATSATPDQMKEMFQSEDIRMIHTKGESHGTVTCRINNKENFEITTLRIDVTTDGRHAEVRFTRDWEQDALRRDLTINSMFLAFDGTVHDYFDGRGDLEKRCVRFVGDAPSRIQEDYLRILRYFRFFGRISPVADAHDASTLRAIKENMHGLEGISGERIWVELKKIVTGPHAGPLIKTMLDLGLAKYIGLREKCDGEELDRVWEKCCDLNPLPFTLLPALMKEEDEMYKINDHLKLSRDELRLGLYILQHREDAFTPTVIRHCQDLMCDTAGKEPKTKDRICELLKYLNHREALEQFSPWTPPKFPVNGVMLLERGVPKGPALMKALTALRAVWRDSNYTMGEKDLLECLDGDEESV